MEGREGSGVEGYDEFLARLVFCSSGEFYRVEERGKREGFVAVLSKAEGKGAIFAGGGCW